MVPSRARRKMPSSAQATRAASRAHSPSAPASLRRRSSVAAPSVSAMTVAAARKMASQSRLSDAEGWTKGPRPAYVPATAKADTAKAAVAAPRTPKRNRRPGQREEHQVRVRQDARPRHLPGREANTNALVSRSAAAGSAPSSHGRHPRPDAGRLADHVRRAARRPGCPARRPPTTPRRPRPAGGQGRPRERQAAAADRRGDQGARARGEDHQRHHVGEAPEREVEAGDPPQRGRPQDGLERAPHGDAHGHGDGRARPHVDDERAPGRRRARPSGRRAARPPGRCPPAARRARRSR